MARAYERATRRRLLLHAWRAFASRPLTQSAVHKARPVRLRFVL